MQTIKKFDAAALRRGFIGISGIYVLSIALLLVSNVILVRTLSVSDFGTFGFALSLATVLALPGSGGLPLLVTREVASYAQQGNWSAYRGLVEIAYRWVALVFLTLAPLILVWGSISEKLAKPQLIIICILIPLLGLNGVRNAILRGIGRPVLAETLAQVIQPLLMITGYLLLAWLGLSSANSALWWYVSVLGFIFVVATIALNWVQPVGAAKAASDFSDLPQWRKSLPPLVFSSAAALLSTQAAILIAGFLGKEEVVAYLRVAERGAMFIIIPFHVLGSIIGPHMVAALASTDIKKIKSVVRQSSRLMVFTSVPIATVIVLFGEKILYVAFGAPYEIESYHPMVIVSIVQIFFMGFGHIGMLILMAGREKQMLASQAIALGVNVAICTLLIGPFGAVGASFGIAAGVVVSTMINVLLVKRHFEFIPGMFIRGAEQ